MVRWKLKSCPRCGGDMFTGRDMNTWYEQCLQCSYRSELKSLENLKRKERPVPAGTAEKGSSE